jgi:GcrA cell cycle regulator
MVAWTEADDSRLRALHGQGLSYGRIAQDMAEEGFPARARSAVIGRARRLGLPARDVVVRVKTCRTLPIVQTPGIAPSGPGPARSWGAVTLGSVRDSQCRWPLGESQQGAAMPVCGEPVRPGTSCCPTHYALAYRPAAGRPPERFAGSYARHDGMSRPGPRARNDGAAPERQPDLVDEMGAAR